uniref:Uncharacterized protein n=1 Tax=Timema cristinae TaxID=61476 RepID=A0A7R9C9K0_TIMCR|nr:unnamed protein product [Timema cristinae]
MKLLELYLELVEKESYLVSSTWKGFQISFYVIIVISGLISCISFSNALNDFNLNCMLYSNITFQSVNCDNATQAELPPFDSMKTEFGKQSLCAFCQYAPVCSAIFAFLWAVLFTMCGTGGKTKEGLSQPWRIVYPALIFNFIYLIISTTSSVLLEQGHDAFCDSFMTSSWFNMLAWLLATVLLLLRCSCAADFEVIKITIHTPEPDHDEEAPQLPFIDGASSSKETVREEEVTNVRLERHN